MKLRHAVLSVIFIAIGYLVGCATLQAAQTAAAPTEMCVVQFAESNPIEAITDPLQFGAQVVDKCGPIAEQAIVAAIEKAIDGTPDAGPDAAPVDLVQHTRLHKSHRMAKALLAARLVEAGAGG